MGRGGEEVPLKLPFTGTGKQSPSLPSLSLLPSAPSFPPSVSPFWSPPHSFINWHRLLIAYIINTSAGSWLGDEAGLVFEATNGEWIEE